MPNVAVLSGGVVGKSLLFKLQSLAKIMLGVVQATWILWRNKPLCVVGFGGYASFPACVAAVLSGTPLVIHEQNSVMSRTNRILARFSSFAAQSFNNVKNTPSTVKSVLTGMPVRESIVNLFEKKYKPVNENGKINLVIIGGSQGAQIFAELIPDAIALLSKEEQEKLEKRISVL